MITYFARKITSKLPRSQRFPSMVLRTITKLSTAFLRLRPGSRACTGFTLAPVEFAEHFFSSAPFPKPIPLRRPRSSMPTGRPFTGPHLHALLYSHWHNFSEPFCHLELSVYSLYQTRREGQRGVHASDFSTPQLPCSAPVREEPS